MARRLFKALIDSIRCMKTLQNIVGKTGILAGRNEHTIVRLPTGDGIALVFFGDPEAPVDVR